MVHSSLILQTKYLGQRLITVISESDCKLGYPFIKEFGLVAKIRKFVVQVPFLHLFFAPMILVCISRFGHFYRACFMMTSSNGNIFRVTGTLCGEFTGPGEFPTQRPVTRSFDVFYDLRLNKRLSKQPWGWWLETPSWSLWRHCNVARYRHIPYNKQPLTRPAGILLGYVKAVTISLKRAHNFLPKCILPYHDSYGKSIPFKSSQE